MNLHAVYHMLLIATLGWALSATSPVSANDDEGALVGLDTVIEESTIQTVPVIGRLVPARSGVVSVLSQGVVEQLHVRVGDRVQAGDEMAILNTNRLSWARELKAAQVASARASLTNAKTQTSLRKQELKRLENLKKSAAFSAARFEDAQKEYAKAQSDAARAQAELDRATADLNLSAIDLNNAKIIAPYSGVVSTIHTEIGTYLNVGESVVTLVDDSQMEIEADVPAHRTHGLLPNTQVNFSTNGDTNLMATVRAVVPDENPLTRTRTVRFAPDASTQLNQVAANQTVHLLIPAGPKRVVTSVHKDAILNRGGKRVVFIAQDGKVNIRPVTLGDAVGTRFVVLSGLEPGDTVVVRGNERLRPGQAIRPNNGAHAGTAQVGSTQ
ncbi:MAG: efflux RND transporter periplasmic adaptor subunit [Magnetovibrio sp.]|nr:efflux RND transporter periplasmic adaptor subunit [Magnetovibrio sp.]